MIISEITGVKKWHHLTPDEVLEQLSEIYGLRVLGSGSFGKVIQIPGKNYVYKVFDNDDAYLSFVNYVMTHPDPHFPTFIKAPRTMHSFYKRAPSEPNKFTIVGIEILYPIAQEKRQYVQWLLDVMQDISYNRFDITEWPAELPNGDWNYKQIRYKDLMQMYPQMETLINSYTEMHQSQQIHGEEDLHLGNIMQRADGTIVIVDPVANHAQVHKQMSRQNIPDIEKTITGPQYKSKT